MYTAEQIREAGISGEISSIDVEHLIKILEESNPISKRSYFKKRKIDFFNRHLDKVKLLVSGKMSKKEKVLFCEFIRKEMGYSKKTNSIIIIQTFKNELEKFELFRMFNEL